VKPLKEINDHGPQVTGNHSVHIRQEKAAIRKLLASSNYLLPVHDKPAKIGRSQVVGRLDDQVPGAGSQTVPRRNWFPA